MKYRRITQRLAVGLVLLAVAACTNSTPVGTFVPFTPTPRRPTPTHILLFPLSPIVTQTAKAPPYPTFTAEPSLLTGEPTATSEAAPSPFSQSCTPTQQTVEGHFLLGRPIGEGGRVIADRTYPYGSTLNGEYEVHHGLEFPNAAGTSVIAVADGVVVAAGSDAGIVYGPRLDFYGNLVVIEHHFPEFTEPIYSLYGHLSKVLVNVGQEVEQGEQIGEVGATGVAIGSHLHFEVRQGLNSYYSTRNPLLWLIPLANDEGQQNGVIAGYIRDPEGRAAYLPEITVEFLPEPGDLTQQSYFVEAYAGPSVNGDNQWGENFVIPELPPGRYEVSFVYRELFRAIVEVKPGLLTLVGFCVPG